MNKEYKGHRRDRRFVDSWCEAFTKLEKDHPARLILKLFVVGRIKFMLTKPK